ncbi:MAG: MFS transporter [Sandaracinaceae bacterium]|nr:MFS transporter [Sandaracinaceae bacterium]
MPGPRARRGTPWWANLLFSVVLPSLVLSKLSAPDRLGVTYALVLAVLFPLSFGVYEAVVRRRLNPIALLGLVSTLLTGGMGLMLLDGFWFAVKEASVPFIVAVGILVSARTQQPLVTTFFYDEGVLNRDRIARALETEEKRVEFAGVLARASLHFAGAFLLSAALNFGLARIILKSQPGTEAFNVELARMTALSWPVIALPSMVTTAVVMWVMVAQLRRITGLDYNTLLNQAAETDDAA